MNSHVPVIAVLDTPALKGARSTLRGIIDYAERHGPWRLLFLESRDEEQVFDYAKLGCDAAVACRVPQSDVLPIAKLKVPVILCEPLGGLIGADTPLAEFPVVRMDSRAVGAMAAKYYLERGYRSFAYVGETLGMYWSAARRDGFVAALREAGYDAVVYDGPRGARDGRARLVIDACVEAGLRVPEDIAVLGVDDDQILCCSCVPQLSSIRTGGYRRGVRIAELLDEMMHGRAVERTTFVEEPLAVVTRGSTGYDAMRDPILARALAFIHRNGATARCSTSAIAAAAQCSRRYLEKRFRKLLGVSVRDLVMREKIERAKNLLEKGTMPIGEIPSACGVSCNSHLSVLFKKATGVTMREWRHAHRDASDE